MAKKTSEELREDVKKTASTVVDAAKPAVRKAAKVGTDAAKTVKATAKKVTPQKPEYYVQFNGREVDMCELSEKAKAAFRADHKRTAVVSCRIYLKPEDSTAYYVVNDTYFGRIDV